MSFFTLSVVFSEFMNYTKISYRRTFNLGNYENETIELSADLTEEDNMEMCFEKLMHDVCRMSRYSATITEPAIGFSKSNDAMV